jgi:fucose permease
MVLPRSKTEGGSIGATFRGIPPSLIAMIFLVTGVEASAGAWLTTYTGRGGHQAAAAIAAPTCLWAGLLLSRLFWTVCGRWLSEARIVLGSVALMSAAAMLLIASEREALILIAAFCLGFCIGPTYPLLLSWALRLQPGGTIFFVAGVGSACLPWATGLISTQQGSLRLGMAVPLAGALIMLLLAAVSPVQRWSAKPVTE